MLRRESHSQVTIVFPSHAKENVSLLLFIIKSIFKPMYYPPKSITEPSRNEKAGIILVDRQKDIWSLSEYEFEYKNLNTREQFASRSPDV